MDDISVLNKIKFTMVCDPYQFLSSIDQYMFISMRNFLPYVAFF